MGWRPGFQNPYPNPVEFQDTVQVGGDLTVSGDVNLAITTEINDDVNMATGTQIKAADGTASNCSIRTVGGSDYGINFGTSKMEFVRGGTIVFAATTLIKIGGGNKLAIPNAAPASGTVLIYLQEDDTDTGPEWIGADDWGLRAGGKRLMRLTESGDIGIVQFTTPNGGGLNVTSISEDITITGDANLGNSTPVDSAANLAPANSIIKAVLWKVLVAPGGGATALDIGRTGGTADEFADGVAVTVNSKGNSLEHASPVANIIQPAENTLTLTTDADVTGADMIVRVTVIYETITNLT